MKTCSITLGGTQSYEKFKYPAGEMQVRLNSRTSQLVSECELVLVRARVKTAEDILEICMLCDAIRSDSDKAIALILPYLPYARADRRFVAHDCFGLNVFANILNSLRVSVFTLDAHSPRSLEAIDRLTDISPVPFMERAIKAVTQAAGATLLFPDEGARQRYSASLRINGLEILQCLKVRDKATGKLFRFTVPERKDIQTEKVILLDDICDGGGTFLGIAEALAGYDLKISLYVTHGIFSNRLEPLLNRFETIYTTDSFENGFSHPNLVVYQTEALLQKAALSYFQGFLLSAGGSRADLSSRR